MDDSGGRANEGEEERVYAVRAAIREEDLLQLLGEGTGRSAPQEKEGRQSPLDSMQCRGGELCTAMDTRIARFYQLGSTRGFGGRIRPFGRPRASDGPACGRARDARQLLRLPSVEPTNHIQDLREPRALEQAGGNRAAIAAPAVDRDESRRV